MLNNLILLSNILRVLRCPEAFNIYIIIKIQALKYDHLYALLTRKASIEAGIRQMQYAEMQLIIVLRGRHLVCHLGICNPICFQTSTTDVQCHYAQFSEKNKVSILING